MINKTFPLTKNLVLPLRGEDLSNGAYLFVKEQFGLSYENFRPNPELKVLNLDLVVRRVDTNGTIHLVKLFNVTEQGTKTDTILNSEEYSAYLTELNERKTVVTRLEADIRILRAEITVLQEELHAADEKDKPIIIGQISEKQAMLAQLDTELMQAMQAVYALPVVNPEYEYILPYSEVVSWFNNEGIILEEHLEDAMNIPFGNGVIGDYLK